MKIITQSIQFDSQGFRLDGILHLPDHSNPPLVVGSHGLEGTKNSAKQQVLGRLLPERGIAFFRFDHRGCGNSSGSFVEDTSLEKRTTDFVNAVMHILSLGKTGRKVALFGSSMGGATCINAWQLLEEQGLELYGAVLCAAPVQSRSIVNIPLEGINGRPALPLQFFEKNLLFDIRDAAGLLHDLLVFHGDADEIVPVQNAHDIYNRAKDPKKLVIHENGDHQMTSPKDQDDFEQLTPEWFSRCFSKGIQLSS